MNTVLNLLNNLKFPKNKSRHNVMYDKPSEYCHYVGKERRKIWKKGLTRWCHSFTFGKYKPMFKKNLPLQEYKLIYKYPVLYLELQILIKQHDPNFKTTQITVNKLSKIILENALIYQSKILFEHDKII